MLFKQKTGWTLKLSSESQLYPQARVMLLDRYIKPKYLYTLSLIIKDDSKVKQISKQTLALLNSNHHHPAKPVASLSVKMARHHDERLFNALVSSQ